MRPSRTIRIRPPCSTTNSRPVPSRGLTMARGEANPSTTVWSAMAGGVAPAAGVVAAGFAGAADGQAPPDVADGVRVPGASVGVADVGAVVADVEGPGGSLEAEVRVAVGGPLGEPVVGAEGVPWLVGDGLGRGVAVAGAGVADEPQAAMAIAAAARSAVARRMARDGGRAVMAEASSYVGSRMRALDGEVCMERYDLAAVLDRRAASGGPYLEFQRSPDLSTGLYVLPAGGADGQRPHTEDEIYLVLAGHAAFTAGDVTVDVRPDDVLFVPAGEPHRFHDIREELRLLVVFGPAEESRAG
jgi:mannose-6-phosphate isomerase-like protein (cupin superfamily)